MLRKVFSLLLTFSIIISLLPTTLAQNSSHIIINQVYGGGGKSDTPISHSFIEIYNPTDATLDLSGWSVQYAYNNNTSWRVIPLTGSLPSRHSLLIRGAAETTSVAKLQLQSADIDIPDLYINNKQFRVAIVNSNQALTCGSYTPDSSVIDFVCVKDNENSNTIVGEGGTSEIGISKQYSARRIST